MPSCYDVYILQSMVDGELDSPLHAAVEAHLVECAACRRTVAELRAVSAPLHAVPLTEAPPDLLGRVLGAVTDLQPLAALACDEALEALTLSHDEALDHVLAQRLEAHLGACPDCAHAARRTGRMVAALRAVEPEPAPLGLLTRIMAATEQTTAPPPRQPVLWRRWAMGAAGLAAAAAIMLALMSQWPVAVETSGFPAVAVAPAGPGPVAPSVPRAVPEAAKPQPMAFAAKPEPARPAVAAALKEPASRRVAMAFSTRSARPAVPVARTPVAPPAPSASSPPPAPAPEPPPLMLASLPRTGAVQPVAVAGGSAGGPPEASLDRSVPVLEPRPSPVRLASRPTSQPAPVMVAALPTRKAAPSVEPLPPNAAEETRKSWVSRPPAEEHEVVLADSRPERVAMAKAEINDTARRIVRSQPKMWEIH